MKKAVLLITTMVAFATPVLAADLEMDGIWQARMQQGFRLSTLDMVVVNNMVRMRFSGKLASTLSDCEFVGSISDSGTDIRLKANNRKNACEQKPQVAISRANSNTLQVRFSGASVDPIEIQVHGVAKQTHDHELPVSPAGFDVLGVSTGMTRETISLALKSQQFAESDMAGDAFSYKNADATDIVVAVFEDFSATAAQAPAVGIFRQVVTAPGKRLTVDQMDQALAAKYGTPSFSKGRERSWYFDVQGRPIASTNLKKDNWGCVGQALQQPKTVRLENANFSVRFLSGCGNQVFADYKTDSDGRVAGMQIKLINSALALNAAWHRQMDASSEALRKDIGSLATVPEAPKL